MKKVLSVKILHYSLGLPPYRTGGLTKFSMDLMKQQIHDGHDVTLLWPGEMSFLGKKTRIKPYRKIEGIQSYEVKNPVPISYDEGIKNPDIFMEPGDINCYRKFISFITPDVIHIHTLMGLHKSLLDAAKERKIRIVFTAHDFFPICPKVTLFRNGQVCDCINTYKNCQSCNETALSIWKIKLLQTPFYRKIKNTSIIKKVRKQHRSDYLSGKKCINPKTHISEASRPYIELRGHYSSLLDYIDIIHYNSFNTRKIYEKYLGKRDSKVISITHSDIKDNRKKKVFNDDFLKITYLGPESEAKGFFFLKSSLDILWNERKNFSLKIFFQTDEISPYMEVHNSYIYPQLEEIFKNTDILAAPSLWYETFGFTVLEAISHGVPVIITKNVGAKDIIPKGSGIILKNLTPSNLAIAIKGLAAPQLSKMNAAIINKAHIMTIKEMSEQISEKCYTKLNV